MKTLSLFLIFTACAAAAQNDRAGLQPGTLAEPWLTGGPDCLTVPDWQVPEYNEDFYILRESGCVHFEKPFLYKVAAMPGFTIASRDAVIAYPTSVRPSPSGGN